MLKPVPSEFAKLFNEYNMHILTPEDLTEGDLGKFSSNVGEVLYYAKLLSDKPRLLDFLRRVNPCWDSSTVNFTNVCLDTNVEIKANEGKVEMKKVWNEPFDSGVEEGIRQGFEKGIEKGIEQGIEQGIEKGREQGREKERSEIIERMIANLRPQKTDEELCSVLKSFIGISEDEARNYIAMAR